MKIIIMKKKGTVNNNDLLLFNQSIDLFEDRETPFDVRTYHYQLHATWRWHREQAYHDIVTSFFVSLLGLAGSKEGHKKKDYSVFINTINLSLRSISLHQNK